MEWDGPGFVIAIIAISTFGWLASSWIRARHGYPVENEWSGVAYKGDAPAAARQIELLSNENGALKSQVARLEQRLANVERIVTDESHRTALEIEALRGPSS